MIKKTARLFIRYWVPVLVYSSLILLVSSIPARGLPSTGIPDKVFHFCEYLLFGMLLFRLLSRDYLLNGKRLWITHILIVGLFSMADEWLQGFVPGRDSDLLDCAADLAGGIMGAFSYCIIRFSWDRLHKRI